MGANKKLRPDDKVSKGRVGTTPRGNLPGVNHRTGIRQKPLPPRTSLMRLNTKCDAYRKAEKKIGKVLKDLGFEDVTIEEKTVAIALGLPGEAGELPTRRIVTGKQEI